MTVLVLSLLPLSFSFCYSTILPSLSPFSQGAMLIVPGPRKEDLNDMLVQEFPDILASLMRKLQTICLWPGNKVELGMRRFGVGMRLGWKWESRAAIPV